MKLLPAPHTTRARMQITAAILRRVFILLLAVQALTASPLANDSFDKVAAPFFKQHCDRCHDAKKQKGDFRLDTLERDFTSLDNAQRWAEVAFRVKSGEMPPKDETQPTATELGAVVDFLSAQLREGEAARMAKRGPVNHYRLSRDEYAATVYDLLGVHFDPHLPGAFNEDPRWHGYDRIGALLSLSPSHIERYLKAAETILERAFPETVTQTGKFLADAIQIRHPTERKKITEMGLPIEKIRVPVWPDASVAAFRGYWDGKLRGVGLYRGRVKLSGLRGLNGAAPHLSVWHSSLKRSIFDEDILAPEDSPTTVEFEVYFSAPAELEFRNEVPATFSKVGNHTLNVLNGGGSIFLGSGDMRRTNPTGYKLFDDRGNAIHPMLLIDSVEWEGPIVSDADLKKREGLMPQTQGDLAESRACLAKLATRAWRRPVEDKEIDRYVHIVESELQAGAKFRAAHLSAMAGILTSKNFYYLEEGSPKKRRDTLNDWEIASRLSYFLWGSMPDDTLFAAAKAGHLREATARRAHVDRMLNDARISRFTDAFPNQWLQLHKIGMFPPDPKLYPGYDLWLEKSMRLEPATFFNEVFTKNLPIREFLDSNWAMVNPRLAGHYGLDPLQTSGFQRVALKPENHRGGLLTQAGVLMLTSDGTRHRPVHRGVWVSESIFGRTPPPPPPNVEPLEPTPADKPKSTVRAQLESHSTNATCASCHAKIDPLGFAFDHFDAIGRWRTHEISNSGKGENPPVNAASALMDGRPFANSEEFKKLLVNDIDRFAEAFVEQLATFALRRVMTIDDRQEIRAVAQACRSNGYRLRDIVEHLAVSDIFAKR